MLRVYAVLVPCVAFLHMYGDAFCYQSHFTLQTVSLSVVYLVNIIVFWGGYLGHLLLHIHG